MAKPPEKSTLPTDASQQGDYFAEELAKRLGSILPQGQRSQVIAQVVSLVTQERFSGPIAHPKHLREYEQISPGAADRIICMAESTLDHNREIQSQALTGEIEDMKEGRRLGFAALVVLIAAALTSGLLGHEILAGGFLGAGALGIVGNFIKGRSGKSEG